MSETWIGIALASAGALTTMAGAALYVLPGPGIPLLTVGIACPVTGVAILGSDATLR
ncbi:hypothetical protein [Streptomyces chryseus]|uniref:hypothetical protein n=1 Tax=Streptomyces chryseus TaxID=68186 RepID=UPI00142EBA18|nr:hypothetical protein [Streptomyces chryseus]GGX44765.1 hypothetical protein GCM10010353_69530 [Streptomyces chryseus]